jgi:hypothetical protein
MSCADTRAIVVSETRRVRAAMVAALDGNMDYLVALLPGQITPWFFFVTGAMPL